MVSTRKTILSLAILAVLAALTPQAATVDLTHANTNTNTITKNDDNMDPRKLVAESSDSVERVRRETASINSNLALRFQEMMRYMAAFFRPGSPTYTLLQRLRSPSSYPPYSPHVSSSKFSNRNPFRREPQALTQWQQPSSQQQVVQTSTPTTCNPPCRAGSECCLRKPGFAVASCHRNLLSGSVCGWNHYSSSSPSTQVALQRSTCPCMIGMGCVSATASKPGTCTFF